MCLCMKSDVLSATAGFFYAIFLSVPAGKEKLCR